LFVDILLFIVNY
jgi:hypothetical protein